MMKRVLITGVGGNVGQYLAQYFCQRGYYVIGIYRNCKPQNANYELIQLDLSKDELPIKEVDIVIHAAAALAGKCEKLVTDNIYATSNLLKYAERNRVRQFIYLSSVSVYGHTANKLTLDSDIINPHLYGMCKYIAEKLVEESRVPKCAVIQLPRMLGPFVDLDNIANSGFLSMARKIVKNEEVVCLIPELSYNNYMHVEDLGNFICRLIEEYRYDDYIKVLLGMKDILPMYDILLLMKEAIRSKSLITINKSEVMPECSIISIENAVKMGYQPMSAKETIYKFMRECIKK